MTATPDAPFPTNSPAGIVVSDACSVQWWVAALDRYGNPSLFDGAHKDREGCEQAIYIMERLGVGVAEKRAICRVEIYPPESNAHGANEDALRTLNGIGLGQNDQGRATQPEEKR